MTGNQTLGNGGTGGGNGLKKLRRTSSTLYLSAIWIKRICIQYQCNGKPVSGRVTPSPSGCNSGFTSENQIHIFEAYQTEKAPFFRLSLGMCLALMCGDVNGVIVAGCDTGDRVPFPCLGQPRGEVWSPLWVHNQGKAPLRLFLGPSTGEGFLSFA